jgi:hypothetical protein
MGADMDYRDRNDGWWKLALGAAALGVIAFAFRGALRGGSLEDALDEGSGRDLRSGAGPRGFRATDGSRDSHGAIGEYADADEEPVLGYDGMDRDSLVEWLRDASLDEETLLYIERYERSKQNRAPVLDEVGDLLAAFG